MSEGELMAEFKWRNFHGYEYRIVPVDDGVWEIEYWQDGAGGYKEKVVFGFEDGAGLIEAIRRTIDEYSGVTEDDEAVE